MITLLRDAPYKARRTLNIPKMDYIRKRLDDNLQRSLNFYRSSGAAVKSNHILVTLIHSLNNTYGTGVKRYIDNVNDDAETFYTALGIGSAISPLNIRYNGDFYGAPEMLFHWKPEIETIPAWYNCSPVRVFLHQQTDITFTLLDGKRNTNEDNVALIGIDIGMLMYMFKGWYKWMLSKTPDNPQSIMQFVHQWVLPSMIESHNNIAWMNRLYNLYMDVPVAKTLKRTSFALANSETYVSDVLNTTFDYITRKSLEWNDLMALVPVPYGTTALEALRIPHVGITAHARAIEFILSMRWFAWLLRNDNFRHSEANNMHINEIEKLLYRMDTGRWFKMFGIRSLVDQFVDSEIRPLL